MSVAEVEQVLVVPTERFREIGHFQGFRKEVDAYLSQLLTAEWMTFRPRDLMERSPEFKQLIPYVVLEHAAKDGTLSVFQYVRGKGQGESRLHSKRSIGIGGHVSADDVTAGSQHPLEEGMRRELAEEVTIGTEHEVKCVGLINDDESEVGQVHLGVVFVCQLDHTDVLPNEADILEAGFRPVSQLLEDLDQFETWSTICLTALYGHAGDVVG